MSQRLFALRVPPNGTSVSPSGQIGFNQLHITMVSLEPSALKGAPIPPSMDKRRASVVEALEKSDPNEVTLLMEYPTSIWKDSQGKIQKRLARVPICTLSSQMKQQAVDIRINFNYDEEVHFLALGNSGLGVVGYHEK